MLVVFGVVKMVRRLVFPDDGGACSGDARIEGSQQIERQHDYAYCAVL